MFNLPENGQINKKEEVTQQDSERLQQIYTFHMVSRPRKIFNLFTSVTQTMNLKPPSLPLSERKRERSYRKKMLKRMG